jgi:hypothetical protein
MTKPGRIGRKNTTGRNRTAGFEARDRGNNMGSFVYQGKSIADFSPRPPSDCRCVE